MQRLCFQVKSYCEVPGGNEIREDIVEPSTVLTQYYSTFLKLVILFNTLLKTSPDPRQTFYIHFASFASFCHNAPNNMLQKCVIYLFPSTVCEIPEGRGSDLFRFVCENLVSFLAHVSPCWVSPGRKKDRKSEREACVATDLNAATRQKVY